MLKQFILLVSVVELLLAATGAAFADEDDLKAFSKDLDRHLIDIQKLDDRERRNEKKREMLDKAAEEEQGPLDNQASSAEQTNADLKKKWLENYMDTDFSKEKFGDLDWLNDSKRILIGRRDWLKDSADKWKEPDAKDKDDYLDDLIAQYKKDYAKDAKKDDERIRLDTPQPIPDWVPAPADHSDNGGFTTGPDNGSPVPYKLNGWITIDRGFPWGGDP